ncbi:MmcQ/YjbR family DNA-binding protein [Mesorhizobium amorphae]|uniref:MmcQ/YjbR family DNA-binding protein n=1 Tax=Mesorhizobium amorphae TaxID=71433 RepID=UPI001184EBB0|nr:MmcQ/YjbR family DNA-binding protein [Mesorhizobium amorphae]
MADGFSAIYERLKQAVQELPDIVETTSYGTPALKAGKKLLTRVKDAETAVVMCPVDEKEMLLQAAPDIYFETDHYKGWPALLVRMNAVSDDELRHRLERTWLTQVPKTKARAWLVEREKASSR